MIAILSQRKTGPWKRDFEKKRKEQIDRFQHRGPAQSVWVADCYFIGNVLDLPFASPIAIYR